MNYNNGFVYEGEWKNDKREGKGLLYKEKDKLKKERYEGEFKNGKIEGRGISYYSNGDKYEGEYKEWNKDGKGIYYYNNKDKYEGEFKDDKAEGKGKYTYKNGNIIIGEFKKAKANGKGIIYCIVGSLGNKFFKEIVIFFKKYLEYILEIMEKVNGVIFNKLNMSFFSLSIYKLIEFLQKFRIM